MTKIRVAEKAKNFVSENPEHNRDRRDFLCKAASAGVVTAFLPKILGVSLINQAMGADPTCPVSPQVKGGLMHIYSEGGSAMSARFLNPIQSQFMSAAVANNYGIAQDLVAFGGNGWMVSRGSPFGQLLVAPAGIDQGTWDSILRNVTVTANYGAFKDDDGGGSGLGQLGGAAGLKPGVIPSDILVNVSDARAAWAKGLAAVKIGSPNVSADNATNNLANAFSAPQGAFATNPAAGDTTIWRNSVSAMNALSGIFGGFLGADTRNGGKRFVERSMCGANSAGALIDPQYGKTLFNPATISGAGGVVNALTNSERGYLSAAYRTADGTVPGVVIQFGGRDYHGTGAQNIANKDYEEAQAIKMWLLGAYLAKAPSALIQNSNGSALPSGKVGEAFTQVNVNSGSANTPIAMNGTLSDGDSGGFFSAGFLLCYNPNGAGPVMRFTGGFDSTSGRVNKLDPTVASVPNAIGSLQLTALKFLGADVNKAFGLMQANGVNSKLSDLILLA